MADRFPSIEDIDEGKAQTSGDGNIDLMDGGDDSDFLSRERAALGSDADQFSTSQNNGTPSISMQNGDDDDDLLGGGGGANGSTDEMNQFQSSFPAVNAQDSRVGPGGSITGTTPRPTSPYPPSASYETEEEPSVIKEWRERRDLAVRSREEKSASRKSETVNAAQEAIDEFYENYNNKKEKGLTQTKKEADEFLEKRDNTTSGGTSWERIAKLVDVKGGGKAATGAEGKEKFRDLLVGLMKDENAPAAKGY